MSNESRIGYEESVTGPYRLGPVIRRSPSSAVYETEFRSQDGQTRPAAIKVRELEPAAASTMVRRWHDAMNLQHPHLLPLYDAGTSAADDATIAWVVMERGEESLAGVLTGRALSEDEVGEMLPPTVDALAYLHKKGYAHGSLKPSNVLACGDRLKLSCDTAVRVSEGGVPAEDIRALGALIAAALTERGLHAVVRHPSGRFSEIMRRCSEPNPVKRWTAEEIAAYLNQREIQPPAAAAPAPKFARRTVTPSRSFPRWVLAGLGAVVLVVLLTALVRQGSNKSSPVVPPPVISTAPDVATLPPLIQPEPAPVKRQPAPEKSRVTGRKADGWFVIVGAYGSHDLAEKRMKTLAKRWPAFQLHVSEHRSERAPWLVTAGENLSEDAAEALRARAARTGLARDAYIKRIK